MPSRWMNQFPYFLSQHDYCWELKPGRCQIWERLTLNTKVKCEYGWILFFNAKKEYKRRYVHTTKQKSDLRRVNMLKEERTYWVFCRMARTIAGLVSIDAVTREVKSDQYQIAEASHTETQSFFTLWYPIALRPWILVSHPSLRQRLMLICTSVKNIKQR